MLRQCQQELFPDPHFQHFSNVLIVFKWFDLALTHQQLKRVYPLLLTQLTVHSWTDLDPVCTLKSDLLLVPAGSAVAIFKQPVTALLAGCGRCTRLTCLLTFHLEESSGQRGPTNHHFLCSPKHAQGLQRPNITVRQSAQMFRNV